MNPALGTPGQQSPSADSAPSCQPQWWDHLCRLKRTPCLWSYFSRDRGPPLQLGSLSSRVVHQDWIIKQLLVSGHECSEENTPPASQPHGWIDASTHYQRTAAVTVTPHQPLPQIPDRYQNYTPLQHQPSSLWMDRACVLLIHLVIALLLAKQKKRETKEKRRGQNVHYILMYQSMGLSAPHKDLDLWPCGPVCMIHGLQRPLIPFICLWCVWVGLWCVHIWECTLHVCSLSGHLM